MGGGAAGAVNGGGSARGGGPTRGIAIPGEKRARIIARKLWRLASPGRSTHCEVTWAFAHAPHHGFDDR